MAIMKKRIDRSDVFQTCLRIVWGKCQDLHLALTIKITRVTTTKSSNLLQRRYDLNTTVSAMTSETLDGILQVDFAGLAAGDPDFGKIFIDAGGYVDFQDPKTVQ